MGAVASAVSNVVGDAVDAVGDVVEDVGDFVVEDVLDPIVDTVEATVEAALDDPINTAIRVAAIASGQWWALPLAEASITVAQGGSLEDAATRAAIAYAGGQIAQGVSSGLSPEFTAEFGTQAGRSMANVAGNVAATAATGGDPLAALVNGGLNAGVSAAAAEVPGFADMTKSQQAAVTRAISAELQGKDASQSLINTAIGAGIDAAKKSEWDWGDSSASSTDLVNQTTDSQSAQRQIEAPVNPTEQDMNEFYESIGIDPTSLSDFNSSSEDPLAGISMRGDYNEITGKFEYDPNGSMEGPLPESTGSNSSSMDGYTYDPITKTWTDPEGTQTDLSYLENSGKPLDTSLLDYMNPKEKSLGDMVKSFLVTPATDVAKSLINSNSVTDLSALAALGAGAAAIGSSDDGFQMEQWGLDNQNVNWNAGQLQGPLDGVAYGQEQLAPTFTNAAQGGIMSLQRYATGGNVGGIASLGGYAAGGNPRLLKGPGDGMSDHIPATIAGKQPARLADGEFVMPADVVSHLGNGSTEAGAKVLYKMMEQVRRARTGNPKQGKQINPQKFVPNKGK
jgi:hypothetical protein